jgi:hypothetical protein
MYASSPPYIPLHTSLSSSVSRIVTVIRKMSFRYNDSASASSVLLTSVCMRCWPEARERQQASYEHLDTHFDCTTSTVKDLSSAALDRFCA